MSPLARITVFPDRIGPVIDDNLYGLHLEHIWNCVYGSVWVGPDSEIPNTDGIRNDVTELLKQLRPSVLKYPGGYFSDFYDWRDGVGPQAHRPTRPYPCEPCRIETNRFGTAEFMRLCRMVGAEPFLSVNTTHLTPRDAAHWVEYCNVEGGTFWSDKRIADGYPEPFKVKYWAIGNEQYWLHPAHQYAHIFKLWSHWMYNTDPSITVVLSGMEPGIDSLNVDPYASEELWAEDVLRLTKSGNSSFPATWHTAVEQRRTLYSIHPYFSAEAFPDVDGYCDAVNELYTRLPRAINQTVKTLDRHKGECPRPRLCFDEYGLLHPGTRMDGNMTQPTPFWAAPWLAAFLHICQDHADEVGMATLPAPVNMEHALILVDENGARPTASYHAFRMLRDHGGRTRVKVSVDGLENSDRVSGHSLCVSASVCGSDRSMVVTVVNLEPARAIDCLLSMPSYDAYDAYTVQSEKLTCSDRNSSSDFNLQSQALRPNQDRLWPLILSPCSVTKLTFESG